MQVTVFTKIINREIPAVIIFEDAHTIAFLDAGQVNPGHVIVATKKAVETILELDDGLAGALFQTAARVARALDKTFSPEGFTIIQANKPTGWQTVPHVHLHVLPRHSRDGVTFTWPKKNPSIEELQSIASRISVQSQSV